MKRYDLWMIMAWLVVALAQLTIAPTLRIGFAVPQIVVIWLVAVIFWDEEVWIGLLVTGSVLDAFSDKRFGTTTIILLLLAMAIREIKSRYIPHPNALAIGLVGVVTVIVYTLASAVVAHVWSREVLEVAFENAVYALPWLVIASMVLEGLGKVFGQVGVSSP